MPYKDKEKQRESWRKHYRNNKEKYRIISKNAKEELSNIVANIKQQVPCADCKLYYDYWIMDFDHIEDNKVNAIANMVMHGATKKVWLEIPKCEIVCSNCHRTRTHLRRK